MNFANEIKSRITVKDVIRMYAVETDRNGRIRCPIHDGRDFNCGVKNEYIHCFVCGKSADQIGLVQALFGLSFKEAISKLNEDFRLGLPIGERVGLQRQIAAAKKAVERKRKLEAEDAERNRLNDAYWDAFGEVVRLERNMKEFEPTDDASPHPLYVEAVTYFEEAKFKLEEADLARYVYEYRNS